MKSLLTLFLFCSIGIFSCNRQGVYNIDAEVIDLKTNMPKDWIMSIDSQQILAYAVKLDTSVKQTGHHSLSIEKTGDQARYGLISYAIPNTFQGETIELRGDIKMKQVNSGYAALFLRVLGKNEIPIEFDNMEKEQLKGTAEWKSYKITLPYNTEAAKSIVFGVLLVGNGKAWFDNLQLFIDGKAIEKVPLKEGIIVKAELDTAFSKSSGISAFKPNARIINNLVIAGQYWGFLKYHHPAIGKGEYNWDAELFRFLPQVIAAKDNQDLSRVLEGSLDKLGVPVPNKNKVDAIAAGNIVLKPDYGQLFNGNVLSASLRDKLISVKESKRSHSSYYISPAPVGNPVFENEKLYTEMYYPDTGYRILSLYRYWTMVNYFFPYRNLIPSDWNENLALALPDFINAKDTQAYLVATLKIIAKVMDTHANIQSYHLALDIFRGKYKLPFKAEFIENKLVVTGYHKDTLGLKQKFLIGDVLTHINGKPVDQLIREFLPYTPASNYDTQLRELPNSFLLRGNTAIFNVELQRGGKTISQQTEGLDVWYVSKSASTEPKEGFKLLSKDIGYVFPGKYKDSQLPEIKTLFKNTKGMIIDLRCYPSEFMPYTFGNYIKPILTPFVKITRMDLSHPGTVFNMGFGHNGVLTGETYTGKIVVIVNSITQSQAEFTTMAFQSSPNVKVLGSTTAGADGDFSTIRLPGGISTGISGAGIYYPDGTPTQQVGVKIDYRIKPTIKGTIAGKDELLDKAKEILAGMIK
ncbi:S41 family peptidase [Pedobacter sp. PACM 27299]|uniref:S41 family peptidase n=1 Tax=Pedobacter sp. PACM 27299 TaxID=1727164 RepID=UPI0009E80F2D|nr:S41 family peptidase [Pedobacter sp. PACM 27299]